MPKTEIIIACRGELPRNLERTLDQVRATAPETGLCVVLDGADQPPYTFTPVTRVAQPWASSRGCGQARHYGITTSDAENVVLIDGHMGFDPGWIEAIESHLDANPTAITCACMQSLSQNWEDIPGQLYRGAYLTLRTREPGCEFWALSAKWNPAGTPCGPVGAVMGACYGMRREWYHKIGSPLALLEAWGQDEELLSLCSWLSGGSVDLLPIVARHIYGCHHCRGPLMPPEAARVWANKYLTILALPMPENERERSLRWLDHNLLSGRDQIAAAIAIKRPMVDELRDRLAPYAHRWDWLKSMSYLHDMSPADIEAHREYALRRQRADMERRKAVA